MRIYHAIECEFHNPSGIKEVKKEVKATNVELCQSYGDGGCGHRKQPCMVNGQKVMSGKELQVEIGNAPSRVSIPDAACSAWLPAIAARRYVRV